MYNEINKRHTHLVVSLVKTGDIENIIDVD